MEHEKIIMDRAERPPVAYWFALEAIDYYFPPWIISKLQSTAERYFPSVEISCCSSFTRDAVHLIWNTVVGENVGVLYDFHKGLDSDQEFGDWLGFLQGELIGSVGLAIEVPVVEYCALTGVLLLAYGYNENGVRAEIERIAELGRLEQVDFDFLGLVLDNYPISICEPVFGLLEGYMEPVGS